MNTTQIPYAYIHKTVMGAKDDNIIRDSFSTRVRLKKVRAYINSSFLIIRLEYFNIFFMSPILKNDKNSNIMVKNSSLL